MFNFLINSFSSNIAIDLGTANTLIYLSNQGIVLNEPSVLSFINHKGNYSPYAFGKVAKSMLGKTPTDIRAVRPLKDGVIAEFKAAEMMIKYFIAMISNKRKKNYFRPRIVACVPFGSTPVERRAIQDAIENAGAREVHLIYEPMAAAIGANLPITKASGSMIIDIGGGTTEVAVISLGGIVCAQSIRVGGDTIDEAITSYVRKSCGLFIGNETSEIIKKKIGNADFYGSSDLKSISIKGRDVSTGIPREIILTEKSISNSMSVPIENIIDTIKLILERSPPELSSDIVEGGVTITGGGALLKNLDKVISESTGLKVRISINPLRCVVLGTGKVLENFAYFRHVVFQQT